jgi:DNA-binding PadR family transcriptional regulator
MPRHLGELEQLLLFALLRLGAGAHGGTIRQLINDRTARTISPGAIYTAMDRLERRGYVESWLGEPTPERGGKRKRCYLLRPAGAAALRNTQAVLATMAKGIKPRLEES